MSYKKIHVFTDADLDGTVSYLTLCWFFDKKLSLTVTTENNFLNDFNEFSKKNNLDYFSKIYILDMSVTKHKDVLDRNNVTIVDHHQESYNSKTEFKNAKTLFKKEGSTCKLLYLKLKEVYKKELENSKKLLISLGHDYDSYTLKNKELSIGLNTLFWNFQGNRAEKFTEKYYEGFKGFSIEDKKIIAFYKNKIKKQLDDNTIYYGNIKIGDRIVKVCSIFSDFCINEVAQRCIDITNSEIAIVVNLRTNSVSFRRSSYSSVNLGLLAEKISDGGGHEAAAGGKLTDTFLAFTKLLDKIYDKQGT